MKSKNRFRALLAIGACLAMSLTACSGGGAGGGGNASGLEGKKPSEIRVGVSMPTQTSERWIADGNNIKKQLEAKGYKVDLQFANDDIPTQTQQIDQMLTNGANILIIAPIDGTALSSQLDAAAAKHVPVISYDRLIRDSKHVDFYVSFDNFQVGVNQAIGMLHGLGITDEAGKELPNHPKGPFNIELFAGSPDDNNAGIFFKGTMSVLKKYIDNGTLVVKSGQTKFDQVAILRWSQEGAQKRMEDLLTSTYSGGAKLSATVGGHDPVARGIITALQNAGYGPTLAKGLPIVGGMDSDIASVKLIQDGVQYDTIYKDTRLLAKQAVAAVDAFVHGKQPEANDTKTYNNGVKVVPAYLLKSVIIYKDNIKKELIDTGYYTQDQVNRGVK